MKKVYIKPVIAVEDFQLSYGIANGCSNSGEAFTTDGTCASNFDLDAIKAALDNMDLGTGFEYEYTNLEGQIVKVCYHSSTGISIFGS